MMLRIFLRPALARGELRTIAATTWAEYKKYFEKDAALARHFQVVKVEEPDEEKGYRNDARYRRQNGRAPQRSHSRRSYRRMRQALNRYITGRQLPDKSVSVLDTACAKVAIGQGATPARSKMLRGGSKILQSEIDALEREQVTGASHDTRLEELKAKLTKPKMSLLSLKSSGKRKNHWLTRYEIFAEARDVAHRCKTCARGQWKRQWCRCVSCFSRRRAGESIAVAETAACRRRPWARLKPHQRPHRPDSLKTKNF